MKGRRLPDGSSSFAPGDYAKGLDGVWYCRPPGDVDLHLLSSLKNHTITEHEDGTITVSPSILVRRVGDPTVEWHGFLERGVFRTC